MKNKITLNKFVYPCEEGVPKLIVNLSCIALVGFKSDRFKASWKVVVSSLHRKPFNFLKTGSDILCNLTDNY